MDSNEIKTASADSVGCAVFIQWVKDNHQRVDIRHGLPYWFTVDARCPQKHSQDEGDELKEPHKQLRTRMTAAGKRNDSDDE
eukprot:5196401-Amphidinium_carterae.1